MNILAKGAKIIHLWNAHSNIMIAIPNPNKFMNFSQDQNLVFDHIDILANFNNKLSVRIIGPALRIDHRMHSSKTTGSD